MKFIRKHMNIVIIISIAIFSLIALVLTKQIFFPDEAKAIYGNRLEGRKKVEITKNRKDNILGAITENVVKSDIRVAGRIVNINIVISDETSLEQAKDLGDTLVGAFNDNERAYYDIQIFIKKNNDSNQFPIIGYKHHSKDATIWTKDRAES